MMKSVKRNSLIFFLPVLLIIAVIAGCGSSSSAEVPEGMDSTTYSKGSEAESIIEKYQDGDLSESGAIDKLQAIDDDLSELELEDGSDAYMANMVVRMYIDDIIDELQSREDGEEVTSESGDGLTSDIQKLKDALSREN